MAHHVGSRPNFAPTGALLAAAIVALSVVPTARSAEQAFRVLHHEAVQVQSKAGVGSAEHLTFDAYGRRFELSVSPNERIRRGLPTGNAHTMPLAGVVDGAPHSWVRITRSPSGWRGMLFDGHEMYAIEPAADVAGATVEPLTVSGTAPVVYRLSDALMPLNSMSCEIALPDASTAADAFSHISADLDAETAQLSTMKQVRVGVVGDFEFVSQFKNGASPEDAIVARMNIVDGIFSTQVGVKISLAPPTLFRTAADPFTKSVAKDLLDEVRTYRSNSTAQRALGITHLMTGRDLEGDTVGIAYIGSVCSSTDADSLSQSLSPTSTTQSALIVAHEMGHNFNAPHDGDGGGACASTSLDFLMAPRLTSGPTRDQFSACSIQQIQILLNNNPRCLTAYTPPDAGIEVTNTSLSAIVGTAFVASFVVRSTGDDASTDVVVNATVPTGLSVNSVTANGGTCTAGAGSASCTLGTLAAGDTRQIDFSLTATQEGSLPLTLVLDSTNDPNASNDTGTTTVTASATSPPPPSGGGTTSPATGGGGGGGRVDFALLMMLGVALLAAHRRAFNSRGFAMLRGRPRAD